MKYDAGLKNTARFLRKHLTDSEEALWSRLRRKQRDRDAVWKLSIEPLLNDRIRKSPLTPL